MASDARRLHPLESIGLETVSTQDEDAERSRAPNIRSSAASMRNRRMMCLLERLAVRFNEAEVPLLVLKGAALNLTLYERPDKRPMDDLDLLIKPEHVDRAFALLEERRCLRGELPVREDFFPRFHYETEYTAGSIYPVKLDLHVRPFRPLRYSQLVPPDALWKRAEPVRIGRATVLIPSAEDMLIHLAAHAAIHGCARRMWLEDIKRWADAHQSAINWDQFLGTVTEWRLKLPVREAFRRAENEFGRVCPREISHCLARARVSWRDRLALAQAPRDAAHPLVHVMVNVLCTPGWRFVFAYLLAVIIPGKGHMGEWYCRRHWGWLPWAHLLRWLWPVAGRISRLRSWFTRIETRESTMHGIGVFAMRDIEKGEVIARYRGKTVDRSGPYVGWQETKDGHTQRYEITGKLRYLNHSCQPSAELSRFELVALRPIRSRQEITIDYGEGTCDCKPTRPNNGSYD